MKTNWKIQIPQRDVSPRWLLIIRCFAEEKSPVITSNASYFAVNIFIQWQIQRQMGLTADAARCGELWQISSGMEPMSCVCAALTRISRWALDEVRKASSDERSEIEERFTASAPSPLSSLALITEPWGSWHGLPSFPPCLPAKHFPLLICLMERSSLTNTSLSFRPVLYVLLLTFTVS